jgi:crotonobetainyl-CoA:carnitine CoA-transferase CaiB-like acyl-CoA transferase
LERGDLLANPLFVDNAARVAHRAELNTKLGDVFASKTQPEWVELLSGAGLLQAAVNDFDDLFKDPGIGLTLPLVSAGLSESGRTLSVGNPVRYDHAFPAMRASPPHRGQDSAELLTELGYTDAQVRGLIDSGVVAVSSEART